MAIPHRLRRFVGVLGVAAALSPAQAITVTYLAQGQTISTSQGFAIAGGNGSGPAGGETVTGSGLSFNESRQLQLVDFDNSSSSSAAMYASAFQNTQLTPATISSDGFINGGSSVGGSGVARSESTSLMFATFTLDQPALVDLSADVRCLVAGALDCLASVIFEPTGGAALLDLQIANGQQAGTFTFALAAGTSYTVRTFLAGVTGLNQAGNQALGAQYALRMDFAPVDEPSTRALWLLGLGAAVWRRARRG